VSDCHDRGSTRIRWNPRPDGLEESVQFVPGFNCPVPGGKSHGVHSMEVRWHLRGPAGAVWLAMTTGWTPGDLYPGHGLPPSGLVRDMTERPDGFGLGYHARIPQYEGHTLSERDCCEIGGPCYSDMSYGGADEPVKRFVAEGEQVIWDALESRYAELQEAEQRAEAGTPLLVTED
jgi:hypothetical protein